MPTGSIDSTKIKAVVFDFDGVIVESNKIKHMAFSDIFIDYPECDEIMKYHYAHNATDRYSKFNYIAKSILKLTGDTYEIESQWARQFRDLTRAQIIDCPFVEGALTLLDFLKSKMPIYLASATPKPELDIILQTRELDSNFEQVFGSPIVKSEVLKNVQKMGGYDSDELLFIGDSPEDLNAALKAGVLFVGRVSDFEFEGVPAFCNLTEIFSIFNIGGKFELSRSAI